MRIFINTRAQLDAIIDIFTNFERNSQYYGRTKYDTLKWGCYCLVSVTTDGMMSYAEEKQI